MKVQSKRVAMLVGAGGLALMVVPTGTRAAAPDRTTYRGDLVVLCATDSYVRVAGVNTSSKSVQISANEIGLSGAASDELAGIFPIVLPPDSARQQKTWDLPVPAHYRGVVRRGLFGYFHGTWYARKWTDENGLTYRATGGIEVRDGLICRPTTPTTTVPTTSPATTAPATTAAPTTAAPTTAAPTTAAPTTAAPTTSGPGTSSSSSSSTAPTTTEPATTAPPITNAPTTEPATTPPSTEAPIEGLVQVSPVGWASTTNSQLAARAFDGDPATSFVTQMLDGSPATWAWVAADLGRPVALSRVEWMFASEGSADEMTVRTSLDGVHWTIVANETNAPADEWQSIDTAETARFVRLYFRNPNLDAQLGDVAEMRLLAEPDAVGVGDTPQATIFPSGPVVETRQTTDLSAMDSSGPLGTKHRAVRSWRSANSPIQSSRVAVDGNSATSWHTSMTVAPWTGWVKYDLDGIVPVGRIRWKFSELGGADVFRIHVSNNGSTWTTVAVGTNAPAVDEWQTLMLDVDTRYVRFYFRNPNGDANVGYLSEVEFYSA